MTDWQRRAAAAAAAGERSDLSGRQSRTSVPQVEGREREGEETDRKWLRGVALMRGGMPGASSGQRGALESSTIQQLKPISTFSLLIKKRLSVE